jgi:hypothetical protein
LAVSLFIFTTPCPLVGSFTAKLYGMQQQFQCVQLHQFITKSFRVCTQYYLVYAHKYYFRSRVCTQVLVLDLLYYFGVISVNAHRFSNSLNRHDSLYSQAAYLEFSTPGLHQPINVHRLPESGIRTTKSA